MLFTACPPHHQIQGTRNDILHEWDEGLKGWSTQWTTCFVVFLSSTPERRPAASHSSLLGEPQGRGRLPETETPWRCLEAAAWLRHGWSSMGNHKNARKTEDAWDGVRDFVIVWKEVNRESQRWTGVVQEEQELWTPYRAGDSGKGRWGRAGKHLVCRRDERKSLISEGKGKIGWRNPAAGVR